MDCTDIALEGLANSVYAVHLELAFNSGSTPDIKFGWTGPSGATLVWNIAFVAGHATLAIGDTLVIATSGEQRVGLRGTVTFAATPGTLQLQMAQNVTDAGDTIVREDSYLLSCKIT